MENEIILQSKIKMEVKVASWLYYDITRECVLLCNIRNLFETLERKPEAPDPHTAITLSRCIYSS
jgi:hypothetical protein